MREDLISIIIPAYNVEQYIRQCLDSIINQTYDNLEIIIVNDGSTDNTGVICEEYAKKDNRIKVFYQENKGISGARNTGISKATGKYIYFSDADDFSALFCIEYLYDNLIKNDADIATAGNYTLSREGLADESIINARNMIDSIDVYSGRETCKLLLQKNRLQTAWGKLYKTELVKKFLFPEGHIFEDMCTIFKYYYNAKKVVMCGKIVYYYRINLGGTLQNRIPNEIDAERVHAGEERIKFFTDQKDEELKNLYKNNLKNYIKFCVNNRYGGFKLDYIGYLF